MRAVIQRVTRARVTFDDGGVWTEAGAIGPGLCVLVGVTHDDTPGKAVKLANKLWKLRIFDDADGVMNVSTADAGGEVLIVSQFTLYGDARKGNRPTWIDAAKPDVAEPLIDRVVEELRSFGAIVATGRFRTDMQVELVNDGPSTLIHEI